MDAKEEEAIKELAIAIGYTLDAIDVRATDPRRLEAKQKAERTLYKVLNLLNNKPSGKR